MTCEECQAAAHDAAIGWRAYLMQGSAAGAAEVVFYCPDCAFAEFGPLPQRTLDADGE